MAITDYTLAWFEQQLRHTTRDFHAVEWTTEQYNDAIHGAIREAWPKVFEWAEEEIASTGANEYALSNACEAVAEVNVISAGDYAGTPVLGLGPHLWRVTGVVGASLKLQVKPYLDAVAKTIQVIYKKRYPVVTGATVTTLDYDVIIYSGMARLYEDPPLGHGPQTPEVDYLAKAQHYRSLAEARKDQLHADLMRMPLVGVGSK